MLIEGFEAVDAAPFVDEMSHRTEHGIVVFHVRHAVILRQRCPDLAAQRLIGRVADAEHSGAGLLQPVAEIGAVGRKMRREEHEIHARPPPEIRSLRERVWRICLVRERAGARCMSPESVQRFW